MVILGALASKFASIWANQSSGLLDQKLGSRIATELASGASGEAAAAAAVAASWLA